MRKNIKTEAALLAAIILLASCSSLKNALYTDYSVEVSEQFDDVKSKADEIVEGKSYIKKFRTVDKVDKRHEVIFLDKQYLSIDGEIYAFTFHNIMYYGPSLSAGNKNIYNLPDKMIGLQGYATSVRNPEITIAFIFARKLFAQKGYSSMYEACQINGVSFSSPKDETGYINDFGKWQRYSYFDYFENIFLTRKQDVNIEMYQAVQKQ